MIAGMSLCEVGCVPELELAVPLDPDETHTSFPETFVHFSVALPDFAVAPAFVHFPPALLEALTEYTGEVATNIPIANARTPLRTK